MPERANCGGETARPAGRERWPVVAAQRTDDRHHRERDRDHQEDKLAQQIDAPLNKLKFLEILLDFFLGSARSFHNRSIGA